MSKEIRKCALMVHLVSAPPDLYDKNKHYSSGLKKGPKQAAIMSPLGVSDIDDKNTFTEK